MLDVKIMKLKVYRMIKVKQRVGKGMEIKKWVKNVWKKKKKKKLWG